MYTPIPASSSAAAYSATPKINPTPIAETAAMTLKETPPQNPPRPSTPEAFKRDFLNAKLPTTGSAQTHTALYETEPTEPPKSKDKKTGDDQWKLNLSMGYNRTKYFDTDVHLKSSRVDVTVKDFSFKERTSAEYFNPKTWEGIQDCMRWLDEPTNSFTFSATKNKNVFSLTAFHPKFLKEEYETKHVTGTIDGVSVDQMMPINEPFDGYNDQPGQMHLTRFENTYRQMDWQLGYGRDITLLDTEKAGKVVYRPSVYAGISYGYHVDVYNKPNEYWQYDQNQSKFEIQGGNVSLGNRLSYEYGRANIFAENKFTFSHLEHTFMDGRAEYNMKYNATTVGVGYQINKTKKKPAVPESD